MKPSDRAKSAQLGITLILLIFLKMTQKPLSFFFRKSKK